MNAGSTSEGLERWRGRVALVTGASAGIGLAIAKRLAQAGLRVVGWGRRVRGLEALAETLRDDAFTARRLDLRDLEQVRAGFAEIVRSLGGVDVLVNSAGLAHDAPLIGGDAEKWREILDVNVLALAACTSLAVEDMRGRETPETPAPGHVIHLSSLSGHRVPPGNAMYAASKYAVRAMTEGLRGELRALGSRIRVTAISPGNVATGFAPRFLGDAFEPPPYARLEAEDVAGAVAHVLGAPDHVAYHDLLVRPTEQLR